MQACSYKSEDNKCPPPIDPESLKMSSDYILETTNAYVIKDHFTKWIRTQTDTVMNTDKSALTAVNYYTVGFLKCFVTRVQFRGINK